MKTLRALAATLPLSAPLWFLPFVSLTPLLSVASCGGASGNIGFGNVDGSAGASTGSGSPGSLGGTSVTSEPCSNAGSTRSCCVTGTQTCNGEVATWGACVAANGATLTCGGLDGGGSEDAGSPGVGVGSGAAGNQDAALPPTPMLCISTPGGGGDDDDNGGGSGIGASNSVSTEPSILVGVSPASGQTLGLNGQIKVWVNDEHAPIIAPYEVLDSTTGAITTPGDRTAKAPDGYLWEPALYIAPQTAENGGMPHFPTAIKGWSDSTPGGGGPGLDVPGMDPVPPGATPSESFTGEDIWDVSSLGLSPGTYIAEFVVHDGDDDRAVGCVTIVITPH